MSLPQSSGDGFIVNGQRLTPKQAYARSVMLDGLLVYYHHRYSKDHCCGGVDNGYGKYQNLAIAKTYSELKKLYTDELGKEPPIDA